MQIEEVTGTTRGVPSSITRGDVVRKRSGMQKYIPPSLGIGLQDIEFDNNRESVVEIDCVDVNVDSEETSASVVAPGNKDEDDAIDGIDSATIGTPSMEARMALTT